MARASRTQDVLDPLHGSLDVVLGTAQVNFQLAVGGRLHHHGDANLLLDRADLFQDIWRSGKIKIKFLSTERRHVASSMQVIDAFPNPAIILGELPRVVIAAQVTDDAVTIATERCTAI